jgi:CDGSH iron-sulfur domain-containing protein 3
VSEPVCAQKAPCMIELEAGEHYWCACGRSKNQPLCDGSHKGTEFAPLRFSLAAAKKVSLCGCKRTQNAPFCDGTHKKL